MAEDVLDSGQTNDTHARDNSDKRKLLKLATNVLSDKAFFDTSWEICIQTKKQL